MRRDVVGACNIRTKHLTGVLKKDDNFTNPSQKSYADNQGKWLWCDIFYPYQIYVPTPSNVPAILIILSARNSPKMSPKNNGILLLYTFRPAVLKMIDFTNQLMKIENQKGFIAQLEETAYPTGWNGHQMNRRRITINQTTAKIPEKKAIPFAILGSTGNYSQYPNRLNGAYAYPTLPPNR